MIALFQDCSDISGVRCGGRAHGFVVLVKVEGAALVVCEVAVGRGCCDGIDGNCAGAGRNTRATMETATEPAATASANHAIRRDALDWRLDSSNRTWNLRSSLSAVVFLSSSSNHRSARLMSFSSGQPSIPPFPRKASQSARVFPSNVFSVIRLNTHLFTWKAFHDN